MLFTPSPQARSSDQTKITVRQDGRWIRFLGFSLVVPDARSVSCTSTVQYEGVVPVQSTEPVLSSFGYFSWLQPRTTYVLVLLSMNRIQLRTVPGTSTMGTSHDTPVSIHVTEKFVRKFDRRTD
jgi:hypothetical protein